MIAGLARLIFFFLIFYGGLVATVFLIQRRLQYFPSGDMGDKGLPKALGMDVVPVMTEDGFSIVSWFAPPKEKTCKIIVYFHGNAGNIRDRDTKAHFYISRGYGIFLCGYRGYGQNPGNPTEEGLYKDARAAIKWLLAQGYSLSQLVFYGESLGSGVAVQMATEFQPPLLVLEAPFSSAVDVAKSNYFYLPVDRIMKDRFDSIDKIKDVKSSLLIVHGNYDAVVPYALGQKLFEAANHPKEFLTVERGGHSNLYELNAGFPIAEWLAKAKA